MRTYRDPFKEAIYEEYMMSAAVLDCGCLQFFPQDSRPPKRHGEFHIIGLQIGTDAIQKLPNRLRK